VQNWLRERYESPLSSIWPARSGLEKPELAKAWILELRPSDRFGHAITPQFGRLQECGPVGNGTGGVKVVDPSCLPDNLYNHAIYQPASRFWAFQGIETALFAGAAVALIAFAAWWIHERTT